MPDHRTELGTLLGPSWERQDCGIKPQSMEKDDGGSGHSCSGDEIMGSWSRVHSDIGYLGYRLFIQALNALGME